MLNHWPRQAGPAFEASLALELFAMNGAEAREGLAAFLEKRSARFSDL
jgi:enoyl-CoA hydratase